MDTIDRPVGMYIHQHWSYRHPYCARTWTVSDWEAYLGGLARLGYNTVMIWPVLETMPDPLLPSDRECLERIAHVIDYAHAALGMRVLIALCPNILARDEDAARYAFEDRPFFLCDRRIDPGDPVALAGLIERRRRVLAPLAAMDGLAIIDSDPGGFPGSRNHEYVYLLGAHRRLLDQLRPGIELVAWVHAGWEAYAHLYETGEFEIAPPPALGACLRLISALDPAPWGILCGDPNAVAEPVGELARSIRFPYGAVEGEPSFPMTNFGGWHESATLTAARAGGARGVFANAQTHCLQLPNTLLFARTALGKVTGAEDYVAFAERLLPGHGPEIVDAWTHLPDEHGGADDREQAAAGMRRIADSAPAVGDLGGLMVGGAARFLEDLALQLELKAALDRMAAVLATDGAECAEARSVLKEFVAALRVWSGRHAYCNQWGWARMETALAAFDLPTVSSALADRTYVGEGDTPFARVQNGFRKIEQFVPRFMAALDTDVGRE